MSQLTDELNHNAVEFEAVLGLFDSCGPTLLSYPRSIRVTNLQGSSQYDDLDNKIKSESWAHIFPLNYDVLFGTKVLVVGNVDDQMVESATLAHEAHHLLNLCSSPVGHLLHMNQIRMTVLFLAFLKSINEDGRLRKIRFPLSEFLCCAKSDDETTRIVKRFLTHVVSPFVALQQSLLGKLEISECEVENLLKNSDNVINHFQKWYMDLDSLASSSLGRNLDMVKKILPGPPIKIRSCGVYLELGALQIAECFARMGEAHWVSLMRKIVRRNRDKTALDKRLDDCLSLNSKQTIRYLAPFHIVANKWGDGNPMLAMFCCWMAMLAPVDPRTLPLVRKYQLEWDDLHPGHRFIKIIESIADIRPNLPKINQDWKTFAGDLYDMVAERLQWPNFNELAEAMSKPDHSEKYFHIENQRDPFLIIYERINKARQEVPWCEAIPGNELVTEDPLIIPVIYSDGRLSISNHPNGFSGYLHYVASRIAEWCIFGNTGEKLHILFTQEELFKKACFHLCGMEFDFLNELFLNSWRITNFSRGT